MAGFIPLVLLRAGPRIETGWLAYLAFPLWLLGGAVLLWSFWNFLIQGRGTPAPIDPPKELVVAGFYRYVRNPMYVALILILVGHFFWFGFWGQLAFACLAFALTHLFVTLYEEPDLRKKFGPVYEQYCQAVPRWVPRFK